MKTKSTSIVLFLLIAGILSFSSSSTAQNQKSTRCEFKADMRKLWDDHITWTRNVIFNIIDDLSGTTEAVTRLLQNQDDIGNAFKPYYGVNNGDSLARLLHAHITIAAELLVALKNDNTEALNDANTRWFLNADTISLFLSSLNPFWPFKDVQDMMYTHLNLTATEAAARKNHDYAADVNAYDNVHLEILEMADMLSNGIIKQFPNKFSSTKNINNQSVELADNAIVLKQNAPNPFVDKTVISYFIPENVNKAQIVFYNNSGNAIRTVIIKERGEGNLTVNAHDLSKGVNSYSLIADGKLIDTKTMFHQ